MSIYKYIPPETLLKEIAKDCKGRFALLDRQGNTCALGHMLEIAGVSRDSLVDLTSIFIHRHPACIAAYPYLDKLTIEGIIEKNDNYKTRLARIRNVTKVILKRLATEEAVAIIAKRSKAAVSPGPR